MYGHLWDSSQELWKNDDFKDTYNRLEYPHLSFDGKLDPADVYERMRWSNNREKFLNENHKNNISVEELAPALELYDKDDWKKYVNFMGLINNKGYVYDDLKDMKLKRKHIIACAKNSEDVPLK